METVSKKIKVAFLIDNFRKGGGTENQLNYLARNLNRDKFSVHIISLRPPHPESIPVEGIPLLHLGISSLVSWQAIKSCLLLWKYLRKNKIKILSVFFFDSRIVGTLVGRLAGVERIVFSRRDFGWWHNKRKLFVVRILAKLSDHCLTNSTAVKELVIKAEKLVPEKVRVIHNGVPEVPQGQSSNWLNTMLKIPDRRKIVVNISNLRPVKRLDRFVEVASRVQYENVSFLILGDGELRDSITLQAEELGISDRLHFFTTIDKVPDVLANVSVGVLTSESEGLSNGLIEYAFARKPSVGFNVGGNREVIEDGFTGYIVENGDIDGMAAKIDLLLTDEDLNRSMGDKAYQKAKMEFGIMTMVGKMEKFFEDIL